MNPIAPGWTDSGIESGVNPIRSTRQPVRRHLGGSILRQPVRILGWVLACLGVLSSETAVGAEVSPKSAATHWAFQPVQRPRLPDKIHRTPGRVDSPIDRFIDARLHSEGIVATPAADRIALIRRASFDLIGLPPSPEEVEGFLADTTPQAFTRLVDRLLQSPRYGERWGRHWMDVERYADTAGDNADYPVPELHLYRDYILQSIGHDKPYDEFVREQLAGDILSRQRPRERYAEGVIATSFLALSRRYGTGPFELWHLTLENTLETVGQAFMGLNLKCARCHDHKFDPVSTRDYYGLYGIFAGTEFPWAGSEEVQSKQFNRQKFVPLIPEAEAAPLWDSWREELAALKVRIDAVEKESPKETADIESRQKRLTALKQELRTREKPGVPPGLPVAYAVSEGTPIDVPIHRGGEPGRPGEKVARCVPAAFAGELPFRPAATSSGRLEFAQWLTRASHPLTARVLVNRLWQHHFGVGLVTTPNNLGLRSDAPVHRELLDYLASEFIERGWSIQAMHRLIMNSDAYQRSSAEIASSVERDPANRFHWRFNRQRLDAESLRDAWLSASGELELERPGAHPFPGPDKWTWTQHTPFKERYETRHRSVYLMTQRFQKHPFLALFDGPDTNNSTESRRVSTVPQQALFAMNNPFIEERARALAKRVMRAGEADDARLAGLAALCWQRPLRADETRVLLEGLAQARAEQTGSVGRDREGIDVEEPWRVLARVFLTSNEFLYVD